MTLTQTSKNVTEYIIARSEERHKKADHIIYTNFPDIREMHTMIFWGVFSWSIPANKERWLKKGTGVTIGRLVSTPGDIVRDYLNFYHPTKLRAIHSEMLTYEQEVSAPLYVRRSIIPKAMYVDITSTYYSIVKMVGWNITYKPGLWLTPGRAPLDFLLPEHKAARNYLVSIGLPGPMMVWNGYQMELKSARNLHTNLGLWHLVMDVLHAIAHYAVSLGAIYVHTDGYILPTKRANKLMAYIESFGLKPRVIAEGESYVCGFGNYVCGDKVTARFEPERYSEDYTNVRRVNSGWLCGQLLRIRQHAIPERLYEQSMKRYT